MTRMRDPRGDARRGRTAQRELGFASPVPVIIPVLSALAVIPAAALVASVLGLSLLEVLAVTVAVALAGGFMAHRTVGSVVAGVALLLIRPYAPGERVRLRSPADGDVDAVIARIGIANTTLATERGMLVVPNDRLLKGAPEQPVCC